MKGDPEAIINEFIRPFELSRAPLLRAGLIRLTEIQSVLIFDMHHIIGDGSSMGILTDDFIRFTAGEKHAAAGNTIQRFFRVAEQDV